VEKMDFGTIFQALILGIVEGFTEFLPVSSTGHILLAGHFLGFNSTGKVFEICIQLGAILAILIVYFQRLWAIFIALPSRAALCDRYSHCIFTRSRDRRSGA
jgi:undecaprenyl-diphosphatase